MSRSHSYPPELLDIPDPAVIVLIGAAGAGKTMLAADLATRWGQSAVISLDACRAYISGDPADQDATPAAVELAHRVLTQRCAAGRTTVFDATSVFAQDRAPVVAAAQAAGLPAVAVVLTTSLRTCLARQHDRRGPLPGRRWGRHVPEMVVTAQHTAAASSAPTLHLEGFSQVFQLDRGDVTTR